MRCAVDQQIVERRGSVTGDSAWELCCRNLGGCMTTHALTSTDPDQLLAFRIHPDLVMDAQAHRMPHKHTPTHTHNTKRAAFYTHTVLSQLNFMFSALWYSALQPGQASFRNHGQVQGPDRMTKA